MKTKHSYTAYLNIQIFNSIAETNSWTLLNRRAKATHPMIFSHLPTSNTIFSEVSGLSVRSCCCYCCWGGAVAAGLLLLLGILSAGLCPGAVATEHYSPLSLLKQELQHRQQQEAPAGGGCSPQSGDWGDQYSVECGESSFLNFHDSDCEPKGPPPCDSLLSLNTEKILSQAKSIAEQKRFPFATDNDSTNEELAIAYVLIGSGLYDEAIRHFSTMLQVIFPFNYEISS